jgi:hypothetical protein
MRLEVEGIFSMNTARSRAAVLPEDGRIPEIESGDAM